MIIFALDNKDRNIKFFIFQPVVSDMNDQKHHLFDCNSCIFKLLTCNFIAENEFEILNKSASQVKFQKGELILKQNAKSNNLLFLRKGIVKFIYHYPDGKDFIMTLVKGPKLLGGANLFFNETNVFSMVAVEDADICQIDIQAFKTVVKGNGEFFMAMCEQAIIMFQSSIFNYISLAHKQVNGRIADILLYLHENVYNDDQYEFTLSRKEISEFAACSHENVITTLSKFNKEGIIELDKKQIIIKDVERLREISRIG